MLKISHEIIILGHGKTKLSAQHFLTNLGTEVCFNVKFQTPPTHFRGQLALLFRYKAYFKPFPSVLNSPPPLLPLPLLSCFTERKNQLSSNSHYNIHQCTYICTSSSSPLLLLELRGGLVFLALECYLILTFLGNYTIDYLFSCTFNIFLSTEYTAFLLTVLNYLNKPSQNTSLKQLAMVNDHIVHKSGHFPCILWL